MAGTPNSLLTRATVAASFCRRNAAMVLGENLSFLMTPFSNASSNTGTRSLRVAKAASISLRIPGVAFAQRATKFFATCGSVNVAYACTAATRNGSVGRSRATRKIAGPASLKPRRQANFSAGNNTESDFSLAGSFSQRSASFSSAGKLPALGPSALTQSIVSLLGGCRAITSNALATSPGRLRRPMSLRNSTRAECVMLGAPWIDTNSSPNSSSPLKAFITAASIQRSPFAWASAMASARDFSSLAGNREAVSAS